MVNRPERTPDLADHPTSYPPQFLLARMGMRLGQRSRGLDEVVEVAVQQELDSGQKQYGPNDDV